jgi:hypothetical protein
MTVLTDSFLLGETGDSLGSLVEGGNPALLINSKNSVCDTI